MFHVAQNRDTVELMAEARKVSVRILVRSAHADVKFIISYIADEISLLDLATEFPGGSPIQKAHFTAGIIKKIRALHIHDVFG